MIVLKINSWEELLSGAGIGISVVFIALAILVILFEIVQKIMVGQSKKKQRKAGKRIDEIVQTSANANEIVAISAALHLFFNETHDKESNVITIKQIEKRYSPWNSKIYGLNNTLHR